MMDSEHWNWMAGGAWRTMDRQDWQAMQDRWMGPGMMRAGGWSAWEVVGVALACVLAAAPLVVLLTRRRWRRSLASAHQP